MTLLAVLLNMLAIGVSFVALGVTSWIGARQIRYTRDANHLRLADLMQELRSPAFQRDLEYVERRLHEENDPAGGFAGMNAEARDATIRVAWFYQSVSFLTISGIVHNDLVFSLFGRRAAQTWERLEPFIAAERRTKNYATGAYRFFEEFALRSTEISYEGAVSRLGLRQFPAQARPEGDRPEA